MFLLASFILGYLGFSCLSEAGSLLDAPWRWWLPPLALSILVLTVAWILAYQGAKMVLSL